MPKLKNIAVLPSVKAEVDNVVATLRAEAPEGEQNLVTRSVVVRDLVRAWKAERKSAQNRADVYGNPGEQ